MSIKVTLVISRYGKSLCFLLLVKVVTDRQWRLLSFRQRGEGEEAIARFFQAVGDSGVA
jgi:hypothetical protein